MGWVWRAYAFVIVSLRYLVLLGWVAAAIAATVYLPAMSPSGAVASLVPKGAPAVQAEVQATRLFGVPLNAQVAVVQRNPRGFTTRAQIGAARRALAIDQHRVPPVAGLAGALPVANTAGAFPGSRERSTTIITFLFFRPGTSVADEAAGGRAYARRFVSAPADHLAGVTGVAPAQDTQGNLILRYLPWVEVATVLAIILIVGIYFRSPGAPLATILCAAIAYLVATRVVAWAGETAGVTVPPDLEPVLVVLLLGVTTDYAVFFLAGMRVRLMQGLPRTRAARMTTAEFAPIILTAGLIVAAGIASLVVARLGPLRAFGPALALTVLISMAVAITLAPALIAIFGRVLYLPGPERFRRAIAVRQAPAAGGPWARDRGGQDDGRAGQDGGPAGQDGGQGEAAQTGRYGGAGQEGAPALGNGGRGPGRVPRAARTWRESAARWATARPVALVVAAVCIAGLVVAALGLRQMRLGYPLIRALPAGEQAARAETAAAKGFVPGIMSPTEVLVFGRGVTGQRTALNRLERALARHRGVAGVIGPADLPPVQQAARLILAPSGNAARYGLIMRTDPLGPAAINQVRDLRHRLPAMGGAAGLTGARFEVGGQTALAGESIDATQADLGRIALAIALVILVLLAVFLRALVAPFYLLAASVLALFSALGLTVWIFQGLLGYGGLVYYVPFAVAVLLVSLGSDYNVFVVGRIWEEARRRPLREAVAIAVPRASRAITTAGLALAAGFALLALVPLRQFREIAVAMVLGIIIDTFVVRSLLVPSLVVLFGRAGRWPGGRPGPRPSAEPYAPAPRKGDLPLPGPEQPPPGESALPARDRPR